MTAKNLTWWATARRQLWRDYLVFYRRHKRQFQQEYIQTHQDGNFGWRHLVYGAGPGSPYRGENDYFSHLSVRVDFWYGPWAGVPADWPEPGHAYAVLEVCVHHRPKLRIAVHKDNWDHIPRLLRLLFLKRRLLEELPDRPASRLPAVFTPKVFDAPLVLVYNLLG